tara:strand:+ start:57 stop:413 length:357 start_codon:yes stop_codon:yes gene_type:complete
MSSNSDAPIEELKALAHPLRFRILQSLAEGESNVGEIEGETGIGQPALSQQLAVLRKAGLVSTRKEAKLVFYAIDGDALATVRSALALFASGDRPVPAQPARPTRQRAAGAAHFARIG